MKKINYLILLVLVFVGVSCEPTYKKEYSWAYPVAGDWTVNVSVAGVKVKGPCEMKSYNSSFGKDSIWIDDVVSYSPGYSFYAFQAKAAVNVAAKTFDNGTKSVTNGFPDYPIGVNVRNGKIIGNDSIYFELQFEDDATPYGVTYQVAGHRTTSYEEYIGK